MKTLLVDVTADDIRLGKRLSSWFCPVARAILRALGWGIRRARYVGVWGSSARVDYGPADQIRVSLPRSAARFILIFDAAKTPRRLLKTFKFRLKLK